MTAEITEYLATKLTKNDKRGGARDRNELHSDTRVMDAPLMRDAASLRSAQLKLAELALEQPDAQEWLTDVLAALGLRRLVKETKGEAEELPCSPHTGTLRGYNAHLRGYTSPCTECKNVAGAAELRRLEAMGLSMNGDGTWKLTRP